MPDATKTITVRLPASVHEAGREVAKRRRMSLNRLVEQSLRATLQEDEQKRLYDAFTLVAGDPEETDVEFMLDAFREVVLRDGD